jgi:rhamnosyltransferase
VKALWRCVRFADAGDIVYLLGYGAGPFAWPVIAYLRARGVSVWLNPDGIEWRRTHWSWAARLYLRFCGRFLPPRVDRLICDSEAIEAHHQANRGGSPPQTDVIEYGAPVVHLDDLGAEASARRDRYLDRCALTPGEYYIQVGRLVPENNLELMVRGVLDDRINRRLLVISNRDPGDGLYRFLQGLVEAEGTGDEVVFAGTIYDRPLLQALRLGAYAHLHGHEVGGTNPALVEAMGLGNLILALNTRFNREVLGRAGLYFGKSVKSVVRMLCHAEQLAPDEIRQYQRRARTRVRRHYNWPRIADAYERRIWGSVTRSTPSPPMTAPA